MSKPGKLQLCRIAKKQKGRVGRDGDFIVLRMETMFLTTAVNALNLILVIPAHCGVGEQLRRPQALHFLPE